MPETTPLIKAALNLRGGAGFDVYKGDENYAIYTTISCAGGQADGLVHIPEKL